MFDPWCTAEETKPENRLKRELKDSKELRGVTQALREFQRASNQSDKIRLYLNFLSLFENFLVGGQNESILAHVIPNTFPKIVDYGDMASQSIPTLVQTLRLLTTSFKITIFTPRASKMIKLINATCKYSMQQPKIMQIGKELFSRLFSIPEFVIDYGNSDGYVSYLQTILCSQINTQIIESSMEFLIDTPPQTVFGKIDPTNLFTAFFSCATSDLIPKANMIYCVQLIYKVILYGSQSNQEIITKTFDSNVLLAYDKIIDEINSLKNSSYSSLNIRLQLLEIAFKLYPSILVELFGAIFKYISLYPAESVETYESIFSKIVPLINSNSISYQDLLETSFLNAFAKYIPTQILASILTSNQSFSVVLISVFSLPKACRHHSEVFKCILKTAKYVNFTEILFPLSSALLNAAHCSKTITELLNEAYDTKNVSLFSILQSAFVKIPNIATNFIKADGLNWLEKSFKAGLITIDLYAATLGNLVIFRRYDEIDDFIWNLEKDHPLFSLSEETLETIVFGMNSANHRPIRVYSLLLKINHINYLDPYNAWILGNCYLGRYLKEGKNIFDFPYIKEVANRFLHTTYIPYLLEKPFDLQPFASPDYDHFPLFQFYQGQDTLKITRPFKCISFWIKFYDEFDRKTDFFQTNNLTLSAFTGQIIINSDGKQKQIDADTTQWSFIYISTEDFLFSSSFNVSIQGNVVYTAQKPEKGDFTFASFGFTSSNLMFIGPAIRLFKNMPEKIPELFKNGPDFIDSIEAFRVETVFTPYFFTTPYSTIPNSSMSKKCTIPPTCVAVPYFGFPLHFISMRKNSGLVNTLYTAETQYEFDSLFVTLLNINDLIMFSSSRLWKKILMPLKKMKKFATKEIFLKALSSVAEHHHRERLLSSILFDHDMWLLVDNEILVPVIFEYFSNTDWHMIENFELFLATVILANPKSKIIIDTILQNYKVLPHMLKFIVTMFKISHVLNAEKITWELLTARDESPLQKTIINCLYDFTNAYTFKEVSSHLSFKKILSLMLVSVDDLTLKLLKFAVKMESIQKNFVEVSDILMHRITLLSNHYETWEYVLSLTTGSTELSTDKPVDVKYLPLLLSLVWSMSLCFAHSFTYKKVESEKLTKFDNIYNFFICLLQNNLSAMLDNPLCVTLLTSWFPLVLSYPYLLRSMIDNSENLPHDLVQISELSEAQDPTWSGKDLIIKNLKVPPCPPFLPPAIFTVEMMSYILRNNGFDFTTTEEIDQEGVSKWLNTSPLTKLLINSIFASNNYNQMISIFNAIFFSFPFYTRSRSTFTVHVLMYILLERFPVYYTQQFPLPQFLRFVQYFVNQKLFQNSITKFVEKFLDALETVSGNNRELQKCSLTINAILLDIIIYSSPNNYPKIIESLSIHIKLISAVINQKSMQKTWEYALSLLGTADSQIFDNLVDGFGENCLSKDKTAICQLLKQKKFELNHNLFDSCLNEWINNAKCFADECSQISKEISSCRGTFMNDFMNLSRRQNKFKYESDCRQYLTAHLFSKELMRLDTTFKLSEDYMHWRQFITDIRVNNAFVSNFSPKTFHLCPRAFPFAPPRLVSPSPFEMTDISKPYRDFKSLVLDFFMENNKELYKKTYSEDVSLREIFLKVQKQKYGDAIGILSCKLQRYGMTIKTVLFVFHSCIMLLTYATLTDKEEIQLITRLDEKELHIFLESVYLGHWGQTSLFGSHILIIVPMEQMIYARQHSNKEIEMWTFENGNFILHMKNNNIAKVLPLLERYSEKAFKQLSGYQFLFKTTNVKRAHSQWSSSFLSTDQFLLVMNGLASRSFVDLENYPFFPHVTLSNCGRRRLSLIDANRPPNSDSTLEILHNLLPFTYLYKSDKQNLIEDCHEIPATMFYVPEFYEDMNGLGTKIPTGDSLPSPYCQTLRDAIEAEKFNQNLMNWVSRMFNIFPSSRRNSYTELTNEDNERVSQNHSNIADLELFHVCQEINIKPKSYQTLLFERNTIRKIRNLSARLEASKPYFVKIDKRSLTLCCLNKQSGEIFCLNVDPLLVFSCGLSLSVNGMFLVVDFEFGLSRTYRILYTDGLPSSIQMITEFSWGGRPSSCISGVDWIVATATENHIFIWEIFSASIHCDLEFNEKIEGLGIDEENGGMYVATEHQCFYYSINGVLMCKVPFEEHVTVLCPLQLHPADRDRTCIVGCQSGHIYLLSPRADEMRIDTKKLPSEHKSAVDRIVFHPSLCEFVSIDKNKTAFVWNAVNLGAHPQEASIFTHCATCDGPALVKCSRCNRFYCNRCMCENTRQMCNMCVTLMKSFLFSDFN
ncbi:hypothetical protein TVAG_097580 [Trichomonas vaginalis G3]|uniref:Beige/BEACH domain containing protein n=1 Tax=Trichomonas vaginalis (strain ATCC PRA-98 / G3) TaxID=412133 RepID=A2E290_TRIV3|nr:aggrephagy protein [Trichomonas vaginalis G3]EAY13190.1 hypothetical protein TVAG_097580 [Trichomonas vaginalis G3]KAI5488192.1 aggrephagy protein [Trichomonas vaginalis G3]|eukprot:XP_001325413.1 hypothetical protein [Trichomonas vaginalis G3]